MSFTTIPRSLLMLLLFSLLTLGATGCLTSNSDEDDTPTNTSFSETTAVEIGVPTAKTQSEMMMATALAAAGGFTRTETYVWDADQQAYIADLDGVYGDSTWDGFIKVQYLDGTTPVPNLDLADSIHIILDLLITTVDGENTFETSYDYDVTITGMGTGVLTIVGTGGWSHVVSTAGIPLSLTYLGSWTTVAPDHITIPEGGGCPTGALEYSIAPYTILFEYDGTATGTYTVFDANSDPVAGGSGTTNVGCAP